jgi:hypothetical protein
MRNFDALMVRVKFLDRQELTGKFVVGPINIAYHIVEVAGNPRQ